MLLVSYGSGPFIVSFFFRYQHCIGCIRCRRPTRSQLANLLRRFRAARRWIRSNPSISPPRFGLRWLARRWCRLLVKGNDHYFSTLVPSAFILRPVSSPLLSCCFV